MFEIFVVTSPFFAIVLCGYLAMRYRVLEENTIAGLNSFVLYFALPSMLFRLGANAPIGNLIKPQWMGLYLFCAVLMVAMAMTYCVKIGLNRKDAAFSALVAAFPNSGFMGVPLIVALLGEKAASPVLVTLLVDFFITSSLCIALAQSGTGSRGWIGGATRSLKAALANPLPWAIALGAISSSLNLQLPKPVEEVVRMLGMAATPVALFAIGAMLWRTQRSAQSPTPAKEVAPIVMAKLLIHPLLVLLAARALIAIDVELEPIALVALVLAAALPSASNVSILAERYGADGGRIARIIVWTTVAAFLSFTLAVGFLRPYL